MRLSPYHPSMLAAIKVFAVFKVPSTSVKPPCPRHCERSRLGHWAPIQGSLGVPVLRAERNRDREQKIIIGALRLPYIIHSENMSMKTSGSSSVDPPSAERNAELLESLAQVRSRVTNASPSEDLQPILVAVSKYKPASDILACHHDGHLDFGENYLQELEEKSRIVRLLNIRVYLFNRNATLLLASFGYSLALHRHITIQQGQKPCRFVFDLP